MRGKPSMGALRPLCSAPIFQPSLRKKIGTGWAKWLRQRLLLRRLSDRALSGVGFVLVQAHGVVPFHPSFVYHWLMGEGGDVVVGRESLAILRRSLDAARIDSREL